jgi:hypothetical protein
MMRRGPFVHLFNFDYGGGARTGLSVAGNTQRLALHGKNGRSLAHDAARPAALGNGFSTNLPPDQKVTGSTSVGCTNKIRSFLIDSVFGVSGSRPGSRTFLPLSSRENFSMPANKMRPMVTMPQKMAKAKDATDALAPKCFVT